MRKRIFIISMIALLLSSSSLLCFAADNSLSFNENELIFYCKEIFKVIKESKIKTKTLGIEITETVFLDNYEL